MQLSGLIEDIVLGGMTSDAPHRASLRHEIRTPLNAIKGYGELLVEEAGEIKAGALLGDLGRLLVIVDRVLGADRPCGGIRADAPPIDIVGNLLRTIPPLGENRSWPADTTLGRILLVDDNAANRDLLTRRLVREGYQVTAVGDGTSALALSAAAAFRPCAA